MSRTDDLINSRGLYIFLLTINLPYYTEHCAKCMSPNLQQIIKNTCWYYIHRHKRVGGNDEGECLPSAVLVTVALVKGIYYGASGQPVPEVDIIESRKNGQV